VLNFWSSILWGSSTVWLYLLSKFDILAFSGSSKQAHPYVSSTAKVGNIPRTNINIDEATIG